MEETRKFFAPNPGRKDINGVEWWRSDGTSLWYRYVTSRGKRALITHPHPDFPEDEPAKQIKSVGGRSLDDPIETRLTKAIAEALGRGGGDCAEATEDVVDVLRGMSRSIDCLSCAGTGIVGPGDVCPACGPSGRVRIVIVGRAW